MAFVDPRSILAHLPVTPNMHVADLGAGTGGFSVVASEVVGEGGVVYAVDIQKDLLKKFLDDVRADGISNIRVFWGDFEEWEGSKLPAGVMDFVFIVNTLFALDDKAGAIAEARRIIKPDGKLVVIDWSESFGNLGPAPEHVFTEGEAKKLIAEKGFRFIENIPAGDHHYGLIYSTV